MVIKGSLCSISGKNYELRVYNVLRHCKYNGEFFNVQKEWELGGCNSKNDIECVMGSIKIPIEIKKMKTPDWMQCSLFYDNVLQSWKGSSKNKIPDSSKKIFEELISTTRLFNGKIPPFISKDITYDEWKYTKKETGDFNDFYMDCSNNIIKDLYREKGCYYLQISDKGLYHLGCDICNFNVPEFICDQQLRVRIKVHTTKNSKGFCKLSVTISCQPKNINLLSKSKYSLDDPLKIPENLIYQIN